MNERNGFEDSKILFYVMPIDCAALGTPTAACTELPAKAQNDQITYKHLTNGSVKPMHISN